MRISPIHCIIALALSVMSPPTSATASQTQYVLCTHGLRSLDGAAATSYIQPVMFRTSDLRFKTDQGWDYELDCNDQSCAVSQDETSVILHKPIDTGHEIYKIAFDAPNMEIILDRIRMTHDRIRTSHIEFQCEWFDG